MKKFSFKLEKILEFRNFEKQEAEAERSVLAECMKKTVALEKLKEKRKEEWKTAYDYEEAEEIDEASSHLKPEK